VTTPFADLGFVISYEIEVNPEFPAGGDWGAPEFRFGRHLSNTLTMRIRPRVAKEWVASFATQASGVLITGLFACPNPEQLLVVTGDDAYLVRVLEPGKVEDLPIGPVVAVQKPPGTDLVVIGSFTHLAAIDEVGLRWVSDRLFLDDLEFTKGP